MISLIRGLNVKSVRGLHPSVCCASLLDNFLRPVRNVRNNSLHRDWELNIKLSHTRFPHEVEFAVTFIMTSLSNSSAFNIRDIVGYFLSFQSIQCKFSRAPLVALNADDSMLVN